MNKRSMGMSFTIIVMLMTMTAGVFAAVIGSKKEGLVDYIGAQKDIFASGKASSVVSLEDLAGRRGLYAMGPIEGLDGEITIFDSKPYITQVRGDNYVLDNSFKHGAFFLVWTEQTAWQDVAIPGTVKGYIELQNFAREQARAAGIDVSKPFPFLLSGIAGEIKWHINVDRTEGKPINKELFVKSKAPFVTKNEQVDIIGFYSDNHAGVFLSQYVPAIKEGSGMKNAIHIHLVSRASKAAGHIDDLTLGDGMILRLPKVR